MSLRSEMSSVDKDQLIVEDGPRYLILLSYHVIHVKGNLAVVIIILGVEASLYISPGSPRPYDRRGAGHRAGHIVRASHGARRSPPYGGESVRARLPQTHDCAAL